ncbi:Fungal hydrophobin domain containing protein [Tylopilus felleus]
MSPRVFKSTVLVSVVAFLAIAKAVPTSSSNNQCNIGNVQCCQQMFNSTSPGYEGLGALLSLLGLGKVVGDIGLLCTPINVLGIGNGADCQTQAACCTNDVQNGWINFGCTPINLNL